MNAPAKDPSQTESGVLRARAAMRPEARYKALIEILPDVLVTVCDRDLRVLTLEGGAISRLPMAPSMVIGRTLDELLPADRAGDIEPHLRAALRGEPAEFTFETSNHVIWRVQVVPMIDERSQVSGAMAKWSDVTEITATERALAEHARELEITNAELEQFAYIASHDLSEPLRMINGYLSLLERRYGDTFDADAQQFVEFAHDGAIRMRKLIDDLLEYSRTGREGTTLEPVDLQALVEHLWTLLTAEREGPDATLVATGLPTVNGDPGQLRQLFQNLLGNALKFVAPGSAPVVEVSAEPLPAGGWTIMVQDEGIGFDGTQAERIFLMFQRLHTREEFEGTGVGLAIARKVVDTHRGRIHAEPREGGGARFVIELPAEPAA